MKEKTWKGGAGVDWAPQAAGSIEETAWLHKSRESPDEVELSTADTGSREATWFPRTGEDGPAAPTLAAYPFRCPTHIHASIDRARLSRTSRNRSP